MSEEVRRADAEVTPRHSASEGLLEGDELQRDAQAPVGSGPVDVLVGGGGDPLVFGLPVFVSGSLVLGFVLIGVFVPATTFGSALPITTFSTGIGEFVTAVWAILLGQTMVACLFGLFSAFWFSLFAMLMGAFHNWFSVPTANVSGEQAMFFLAWLIIFVFLTVGIFRLPITYIAIMGFVDIAVLCVLLWVYFPGTGVFLTISGAAVLAFCALGVYAFLNVAWVSTGSRRAFPPLGPPIWR